MRIEEEDFREAYNEEINRTGTREGFEFALMLFQYNGKWETN